MSYFQDITFIIYVVQLPRCTTSIIQKPTFDVLGRGVHRTVFQQGYIEFIKG